MAFESLVKLGVENIFFKITIGRTILNFSCKTSGFCGDGWFFWSIFCQFFVIFSNKTWDFAGLGGRFGTFFGTFFSFFLNVLPHPSGPASTAIAVPTAVNADSRCTLVVNDDEMMMMMMMMIHFWVLYF